MPAAALALAGVYVGSGRNPEHNFGAGSFDLLLNSPEDIVVLALPPWWTLQRLFIVVGILLAVLAFGVIWIRQLRRLVAQRTLQLQQEIRVRARVEQERALETERARIAQDLHDDLGSSLTEIAVLASKGLHAPALEQAVLGLFQAITGKARELVAALDIIVWAVDPKDNSLQSVADYLCDFADEFLSPSGIACRFDVPVALPAIVLDGHRRHGVFLAVKETLNNIVRHAAATEVEFRLAADAARLEIVIVDNGAGFDVNTSPLGKGLASLPLRIAQVGGNYGIESIAGKGTMVRIDLRLSGQTGTGSNEYDERHMSSGTSLHYDSQARP